MDDIKTYIFILTVIIVSAFVAIKAKSSSKKICSDDNNAKTISGVFKEWSKESSAYKIECAFPWIFLIFCVFMLSWIFFADNLGLPKLIDLEKIFINKTDEEMLTFFTTDFIKYIGIILGVCLVKVFIEIFLETNSIFDLSRYIKKNDIDGYMLVDDLNNTSSANVLRIAFLMGFLISRKKETKNIFYIRFIAFQIVGLVFLSSALNAFKFAFIQLENVIFGGERLAGWAKAVFTSNYAIIFYFACIAMVCINIFWNKLLVSKLNSFLNDEIDDN